MGISHCSSCHKDFICNPRHTNCILNERRTCMCKDCFYKYMTHTVNCWYDVDKLTESERLALLL
jgi:hypothetical protein